MKTKLAAPSAPASAVAATFFLQSKASSTRQAEKHGLPDFLRSL